jgi:simple sugar transport system substrate-binding protein
MRISTRLLTLFIAVLLVWGGCTPKRPAKSSVSIAVFVPGTASGSPIYEMLVSGVQQAAAERQGVSVQIVEGGYNQAEWEGMLTSLAASEKYDLIVSSNPSIPLLAQMVSSKFPEQKFLLLDGELSGLTNIYTLRYNQREQAYMAGYLAALLADEAGGGKIGLIAGQEYPAMLQTILPGYREGASAVNNGITLDFRVVGNWYDAAKCAELASGMLNSGVLILLCIAGGANEGAVQAVAEVRGLSDESGGASTASNEANKAAGIIWFDTNGYAVRPPYIVGSSVVFQDKAAYNKTKLFLEGNLPFGTAEIVGVRDGYVDFIEDDPLYIAAVSETVRKEQHEMLARLRSGSLILGERP